MWDGLVMLLTLSAIMAIASFVAGILPLSLSLSQRQLRFITLLGTGVLVGTSLIVIIPEGIETMYSAGKNGHSHVADVQLTPPVGTVKPPSPNYPNGFPGIERSRGAKTGVVGRRVTKFSLADMTVERTPEAPVNQARAEAEKGKQKDVEKEEKDEAPAQPQKGGDDDSTEGHKEGHTRVHAPEGDEEPPVHGEEEDPSPHAYIGVALILGFILMFLVDHLPEALAPSKPRYQPLHISLSDLSRGPHNSSSLSLNAMASAPPTPMPERVQQLPPKSAATTIGLIIHAFADGIALGASSTAPSTSLSLIIFIAIMLHKAPAAFGLTSVLLRQGLSKRTARTHLIFFSLAAPAGAVFTWAVVHGLGRSTLGGDDGLTWLTGWVLLFSGGTFLYVAMHAMAEATSSHDDPLANGYMESSHPTRLSKSDIATTAMGMLIPLLTQVGHVH